MVRKEWLARDAAAEPEPEAREHTKRNRLPDRTKANVRDNTGSGDGSGNEDDQLDEWAHY